MTHRLHELRDAALRDDIATLGPNGQLDERGHIFVPYPPEQQAADQRQAELDYWGDDYPAIRDMPDHTPIPGGIVWRQYPEPFGKAMPDPMERQ